MAIKKTFVRLKTHHLNILSYLAEKVVLCVGWLRRCRGAKVVGVAADVVVVVVSCEGERAWVLERGAVRVAAVDDAVVTG